MGISYETVFNNQLISEDVLSIIPKYCECGGEIEFTNSLSQIYCSNARCVYKIASRLEAMAKAMQVDGWGYATSLEVCRFYKLTSPYQVFILQDALNKGVSRPSVAALDKKVEAITSSQARNAELWKMVKYGNLPRIDTIAYKIFNGFESIEEAYKKIERDQVSFVAERLGIGSSEASVMAVNVYNILTEYKSELEFGETMFRLKKAEGDTILIAITGGVIGYSNKSEYISYLNMRYGGKINAIMANSVTSETDILINDRGEKSGKMKSALRVNDKLGGRQPNKICEESTEKVLILTSKEAIEVLDKAYNRGN